MDIMELPQGNCALTDVISHGNTPHYPANNYLSHWQTWKNNAPDGGGEYRDIALSRLQACLNDASPCLDLANLGLSTLPELLPPQMNTLLLCGNPLTRLPEQWPEALQHVWLDNQPAEPPQAASALEYPQPEMHFPAESETSEEIYPAYSDKDDGWLLVQKEGRRVHQAAEDAAAQNRRWNSVCQPRPLLKATGILAGLALAGGLSTWLYQRWAQPAAGGEPYPGRENDLAPGQRHAWPEALPAVQARTRSAMASTTPEERFTLNDRMMASTTPEERFTLNDRAMASTTPEEAFTLNDRAILATTAQPALSLSEAEAIEREVIAFFRQQNGSFASGEPRKEALLATAAVWLFPTGQPYEADEKVITLARHILHATGRYGGGSDEPLSAPLAKAVIRNWVFTTVFGVPLREYIAGKIIADDYPDYYTLSSLKHLLSLPKLHVDGLLFANNVPSAMWGNLNAMWHTFLREEIPVLDDTEYKEAGTWSLADYNFLALSTGADYLSDLGHIKEFNLQEITQIGASIWGKMTSEGASPDTLPYLITPALWYMAQTRPEALQKLFDEQKPWAQSVVLQTLTDWKKALLRADRIEKQFATYQTALGEWSSKGQLADKFIASCPPGSILFFRDDRNKPLDEYGPAWEKTIRDNAKEKYLCCNIRPCDRKNIPVSLSDEYRKVTRNVADAYQKLDKLIIDYALLTAEPEALKFISAAGATGHPAYLHMRTRRTTASGPGGMVYPNDIFIETNNADLLAVKNKKEERIYALKRGDNINSGYTLYRVDKDVNLYIKHNLLSHPHLWKDYQQEGDNILAGGYEFSFSVSVQPHTKLNLKQIERPDFVSNYLSQQHANRFFDSLYEAGHDYSGIEKVWNVVKHIIPFYDCVEGVSSGDSLQIAQALPSCLLDTLAFIPVVGQAASLSGKYGLSVAQGIRRGVFKASQGASTAAVAAAMTKGIALPTTAQIQSLLKNSLRAMDPGLEMLYKGSVAAGRLIADVSDAGIASKLHAAAKVPAPTTVYQTAKLPQDGPEVSIKKLQNDRYVVVNPQTDEAFGKYYRLDKGELQEAEARFHLPEDPQPSGSRSKRPRLEPESAQQQSQAPVRYNQLPPPANNVAYWKSVERITEEPLDLSLPKEKHSELQKMDRFLSMSLPPVGTVKSATAGATALINSIMQPHNWRAWSGTAVKPDENTPPYISQLQAKLAEHIDLSHMSHVIVRNKLWCLQHHPNLIETDVGQYLAGILDTDEPRVLTEAFKRLMLIVERDDLFLNASRDVGYCNFIIVSTDHTPDPENAGKYLSPLDKQALIDSPVAFVMIPDDEKRVFINAERYQNAFMDGEIVDNVPVIENLPAEEVQEPVAQKASDDEGELYEDALEETEDKQPREFNYASRLADDLTHELTHLTSNSGDMYAYFFPDNGKMHNGKDLLDAFIENFNPLEEEDIIPGLFEKKNFKDFLDRLQDAQGVDNDLSYDAIIEAISTDPMLFANILMEDAETLATIIRDLAAGRAYDAEIRLKRDTTSTTKPEEIYLHSLMTLIIRQASRGTYSLW